jgi:hypothetical protein
MENTPKDVEIRKDEIMSLSSKAQKPMPFNSV